MIYFMKNEIIKGFLCQFIESINVMIITEKFK